MSYRLEYLPAAERAIERLPRQVQRRVVDRIGSLSSNPRPPGCVKLTGEDAYRREAEAALRTTTRALSVPIYPGQGNYSLCHGSGGNAELLIYASRILNEGSYRQVAEQAGRAGVEQYQKSFSPWPCGVLEGGETPGLMLGLAGIGYFYLRLHDPTRVPSILIILPEEDGR